MEIDAIATGWDGWNPKLSIRGFRIRDASAEGAVPLLELPRVDLIVAWTSLTLADLRLREMIVEGPMLAVQRDPQGRIRIAGFSIDPERTSHGLTDWLLRQRQIVVRDALITWNDELRRRASARARPGAVPAREYASAGIASG